MQSLGRVAGMTALLVLCGGAARAQEASVPKSSADCGTGSAEGWGGGGADLKTRD